MSRLVLVRHGHHSLVDKALAGRMPGVSLSPEGEAEAKALARHFAGQDIARVLTSPLERCQQTAAPIAESLGLSLTVEDRLTEIDCGVWTGQSFDELAKDHRWHAWNSERGRTTVPGGEAMAGVQARVMALVDSLADGDAAVIAVTHSDVIKTVVLSVLEAPLDLHDRLEVDPASITTLDLWRGGAKLVRLNETAAA